MAEIVKMTDEEYFALDRISASELKRIYNLGGFGRQIQKDFSASHLGNAVHKYCETFSSDAIKVFPDEKGFSSYTTKKAKEFIEEHKDGIYLTKEDYAKYNSMIAVLHHRNDPAVKHTEIQLLEPAEKEVVILFEYMGLPAKAKLDNLKLFEDGTAVIRDVKTTKAVNPFEFSGEYNRLGYWLSMFWYALAVTELDYSVESMHLDIFSTQEPFNIWTQRIDEKDATVVYELITELIRNIDKSYSKYGDLSTNLSISPWKLNEIEQRVELLK